MEWYETESKIHLAASGPETQYERWSHLFLELAEEFVGLAEEVLENPEKKGKILLDALFPTMNHSVMTRYFGQ